MTTSIEAIRRGLIDNAPFAKFQAWWDLIQATQITLSPESDIYQPIKLSAQDIVFLYPYYKKRDCVLDPYLPQPGSIHFVQGLGDCIARHTEFGLDHEGKRVQVFSALVKDPASSAVRKKVHSALPKTGRLVYDLDRVVNKGYYYELLINLGTFSKDQTGLVICNMEGVYLVADIKFRGCMLRLPVLIEDKGQKEQELMTQGIMVCYPPGCFYQGKER